jgi:hypothetical protein
VEDRPPEFDLDKLFADAGGRPAPKSESGDDEHTLTLIPKLSDRQRQVLGEASGEPPPQAESVDADDPTPGPTEPGEPPD